MNHHVITWLTHCRGSAYIKLICYKITHSEWLLVDHELGLALDNYMNEGK